MKGNRRIGREMALKIIYSLSSDQQGSMEEVLEDFWSNFRFRQDVLGEPLDEPYPPIAHEIREFAEGIVRGVEEHLERIDEVIEENSTNWSLDRMARVDLTILRLGAYELLYRSDVPSSAVINEAIEIGKRFGTQETPSFINGILDKIAHTHRPQNR